MTGDRAVSTVLSFVLTLGISSLLIVGLLVSTGGFVDDQRQGTVRDELNVIGQQIAADIASADRLVQNGGTDVTISRPFPNEVTGVSYRIRITASGSVATIKLSTSQPSVTVQASVRTQTTVDGGTTLSGGDVQIVYTGSQLEVQNG